MIVGSPESENKETGDDKEVEADADKDEEPEDDPKLVGDCQKENGDQSVKDLGGEGGVWVHLKKGQEPGVEDFSDLRSSWKVASPWKVAFTRGSKGKPASDESVAKERSKEGEEDEEREGGCKG